MKEAYALHGGSGDPPDEETSIGNAIASSSSLSAVANKSSASNKKSKDSGAMDKFIVKKPKL